MFRIIQSQIIERLHHITINLEVYFCEDLAVSNNGIELIDREFITAIQEGREPNGSVHDTLDAMRTLDRIEKSFGS